jgi:hypothetical protein
MCAQAWSEGGYSDDLIVAARCGEAGLSVLCPSSAVFRQTLVSAHPLEACTAAAGVGTLRVLSLLLSHARLTACKTAAMRQPARQLAATSLSSRDLRLSQLLHAAPFCALRQRVRIGHKATSLQLQVADPPFATYWNYLRRQLFVMDTYASAHNRRVNHTMLALHAYLSWAVVMPLLTGAHGPPAAACNSTMFLGVLD